MKDFDSWYYLLVVGICLLFVGGYVAQLVSADNSAIEFVED